MSLPTKIDAVLPPDTARAWNDLAGVLPSQLVLMGDTALAVHLQHRISQDLDFFFTESGVDLAALKRKLECMPAGFAVTRADEGTLNGLYGATKVQFLDATAQHPIADPTDCAGLTIASLEDILATKVKVIWRSTRVARLLRPEGDRRTNRSDGRCGVAALHAPLRRRCR